MKTPKTKNSARDTAAVLPDKPGGHGGKVANEHNKTGKQPPTQLGEGQRTPQSRDDRASQLGSGNQTQSRKG